MSSRYRLNAQTFKNETSLYPLLGFVSLGFFATGYVSWMTLAGSVNPGAPHLLATYAILGGMILYGLLVGGYILVSILQLRRSVLISPQGIQLFRWPFDTLACGWRDLVCLDHDRVNGTPVDRLILPDRVNRPALESGTPAMPERRGPFIRLSDFEGWPGGALEREIRQYAPHLFDARPFEAASAIAPER